MNVILRTDRARDHIPANLEAAGHRRSVRGASLVFDIQYASDRHGGRLKLNAAGRYYLEYPGAIDRDVRCVVYGDWLAFRLDDDAAGCSHIDVFPILAVKHRLARKQPFGARLLVIRRHYSARTSITRHMQREHIRTNRRIRGKTELSQPQSVVGNFQPVHLDLYHLNRAGVIYVRYTPAAEQHLYAPEHSFRVGHWLSSHSLRQAQPG